MTRHAMWCLRIDLPGEQSLTAEADIDAGTPPLIGSKMV
jgi:hypothetical protein